MNTVARFALACVFVAGVMYLWRLNDTPAAIGGDEAFFANHGLALARTGADLNGRRFPLLIQLEPNMDPGLWYQAMLVYLEALTFSVLPFAEWSARLPIAIAALVNIVLAWRVAGRYTRSPIAGPIAATVIALSPIHYFLSRQAVDYILPMLFVFLWLGALSILDEHPRRRSACLCGIVLGAGLFSYVSSWLMMPVYLLCTIGVCLSKPGGWRLAAAAAGGFGIFASVLVLWLVVHPDAWLSVAHRYAGGTHQLPGLNINTYYRVVDTVSAYWKCWDPAQLFLLGSPNPIIGVRSAGVFVAPVAILFAAGIIAIAGPTVRHLVLVIGLLSAPLGPVLYGTPGIVQRQLVLLPFVALTCGYGAEYLRTRGRLAAAVLWMALLASPVFFAYTVYDVFTGRLDYVTRFDPSNFRDLVPALAKLDRESSAPQIVLAIGPYDRRAYWHFHTEKGQYLALQAKALFWEPQSFQADAVKNNSLIVASAPSELASTLDRACDRAAVLRGEASVVVWRVSGADCLGKP